MRGEGALQRSGKDSPLLTRFSGGKQRLSPSPQSSPLSSPLRCHPEPARAVCGWCEGSAFASLLGLGTAAGAGCGFKLLSAFCFWSLDVRDAELFAFIFPAKRACLRIFPIAVKKSTRAPSL
jgi:hypothetical protein